VVSYFLRYFSSTSTEQISPDCSGSRSDQAASRLRLRAHLQARESELIKA
jgi:hypothetical protein